jgi:PAS domain S-box-containing protein
MDSPADPIQRLERELRRVVEEAQREADAMFAQYQLSQLLASGARLAELSQAVVAEIVRLCSASAGALWLAEPGGRIKVFRLATANPGAPVVDPGSRFTGDEITQLVEASAAVIVPLGDEPPDGVLALWPSSTSPLDREGLRVVQLSRHELAVAFRGAQLRDMLERERQELTAIVDGATDAILQVDQDCRIMRINPAARQLLGIEHDGIGQFCHDVLRCAEAGAHGVAGCPLAEVIQSGRPIAYREESVLDALGNLICVAGGYSPAAREPGGEVRATAILRDISAVQALEQLREGFVATVSHELRTPLALIRGYTDTLLHLQLDPGEQRQYLERIDHATERLTLLVKEILDIAHLHADPLILKRAPVSVGALIARLRGDLAAIGQDHRLIAMIPSDLPPVDVDSARIGQVLENLVGNALKYSHPEAPVTVGVVVDQEWLMVTVDDEGMGVPESDRALVLEPFHRGRNVRESNIQGTGLGLYISHRLVAAHSGRLWLGDRADGRPGTRVSFTLPLAVGEPA